MYRMQNSKIAPLSNFWKLKICMNNICLKELKVNKKFQCLLKNNNNCCNRAAFRNFFIFYI